MRVLLFDWTCEGHHASYLRQFVAALSDVCVVHVAAPGELLAMLEPGAWTGSDLGAPRAREDTARRRRPQSKQLALEELRLLRASIDQVQPDLTIHMYSDPLIRELIRQPAMPSPIIVIVFFPSMHYRSDFGSRLGATGMARAAFKDVLVARFRRRPDAAGVLTLDEAAAERWSRRSGVGVHWLPEPPVSVELLPDTSNDGIARNGVALVGAIGPRKGLDRLVAAMRLVEPGTRVTIAGSVQEGFEREFEAHVITLERLGMDVDVRAYRHDARQMLDVTAQAQCVVLPYARHVGMSRVLLEAASTSTPIVADCFGLLGHLTRTYRLGTSVDTEDAEAFGLAIEQSLSGQTGVDETMRSTFLDRFTTTRFNDVVRRAAKMGVDA